MEDTRSEDTTAEDAAEASPPAVVADVSVMEVVPARGAPLVVHRPSPDYLPGRSVSILNASNRAPLPTPAARLRHEP